MIIKTLQWNIGGGKVRGKESDSTKMASHNIDGLDHIIDKITSLKPDIVTLQETHTKLGYSQAMNIAKILKHHFINDVYNISHVDPFFDLGQAIISRFPIADHQFSLLLNPKFEVIEEESGEHWISHDKGISSCKLLLDKDTEIIAQTLHAVPIRRFGVEMTDDRLIPVLNDISSKIKYKEEKLILQGDFNLDSKLIESFFTVPFGHGVLEVPCSSGTTPKGHKYDHVLYKGIKFLKTKILNDVLTDHYPVYCEFEV